MLHVQFDDVVVGGGGCVVLGLDKKWRSGERNKGIKFEVNLKLYSYL